MMMIHLHHYNHYLIIVGMLGEGKTVCKFTALSSIAKRGWRGGNLNGLITEMGILYHFTLIYINRKKACPSLRVLASVVSLTVFHFKYPTFARG